MNNTFDSRRLFIYLAFAFGLAWLAGLVIYLNGGLTSPLALPLMAFGYMMAPTIAVVLTRVITREGWADAGLRPNFRRAWPYWVTAWVLPAVLVILGAGLYFWVFPQHFDTQLTQLQSMLPDLPVEPWVFVGLQTLQAILISPLINGLFTFGEEFGWRGYMLPKLLPLGWRKAMLLSGLIWGVWHWPAIAMGHNYGMDYPGYPWAGMLVMVVLTFSMGIVFSWLTLRAGSVWPAVIGHAAINGIANLPMLFLQGEPFRLLGPVVAGLLGSLPMLIVGLFLLFKEPAVKGGYVFARPARESAEEAAAL